MTVSFYVVKSGDELFRIAANHYGVHTLNRDRTALIANIRANNPWLLDINLIRPGDVIMLPAHRDACMLNPQNITSSTIISKELSRTDAATSSFLASIDTEQSLDYAIDGTSGFVDLVEKRMRKAAPELSRVALEYYRMKAGTVTKGQYDHRRRVSIRRSTQALGVLKPLVYPNRNLNEVVRIKPHATVRTHQILSEVKKISRIADVAKGGGVILNVVQLAVAVGKYEAAQSREERTAIVTETIGSTAGSTLGTLAGVAFGGLILATPIGWVGVAIAVGGGIAGGAAGEAIAEVVSKELLFDKDGKRVDC